RCPVRGHCGARAQRAPRSRLAPDHDRRRSASAREEHRLLSGESRSTRPQPRGAVWHSRAFCPRSRRDRGPPRTGYGWFESGSAARMIAPLLIAVAAQTTTPARAAPDASRIIADAAHSISAGRLDEAKLMIGRAIAAGA